jgi:hypothetical protein
MVAAVNEAARKPNKASQWTVRGEREVDID